MSTIRVALFGNRARAEPVKERLAQAGVAAELDDDPGLERLWFVSKASAGVRLAVPAGQIQRTEQLLHDWDALEGLLRAAIRCPECGSLQVEYPQYAHHSLLTNLMMGLAAELGVVEKDYYCEDCHFTWPKEGTRERRARLHLAPYYFIEGVEQTNLAQRSQPSRPQPHREAA